METLDLFFRFAALGVLTLSAARFLKDFGGRLLGVLGALFGLGIAAYLVVSSPMLRPLLGDFSYALVFASIANPLTFYLLSRALFDDEFRLAPWHGAVLVALELSVFLRHTVLDRADTLSLALEIVHWTLAVGIVVLALFQATQGRMGDLIEQRRRFRLIFVAVIGAYTILVMGSEIARGAESASRALEAANAGAILAISATIAFCLLVLRTDLLRFETARPAPDLPVDAGETAPASWGARTPDPLEQRLIEALDRAMTVGRLYRQEGLTVPALADQLGTQEHKLRRIINQRLGYRNFAAFLNHYRIAEVRSALLDPAQARLPILTIAMDAGYRSLGPFNQAFKQATGQTPTEFRRNHGVPTSGEAPAPD